MQKIYRLKKDIQTENLSFKTGDVFLGIMRFDGLEILSVLNSANHITDQDFFEECATIGDFMFDTDMEEIITK